MTNLTAKTEREWEQFLEKADEQWEKLSTDELRRRVEELPFKKINFPSSPLYQEIVLEENVAIPMRDGTILRGDVYRPKSDGEFPVVINRGPYDKSATLDDTPAVMRNLAQRGYVGLTQDVRGRYASGGEFVAMDEIDDGVDTVEWAAKQVWSTGKIGMFGISYNGLVQLCAAIGQAQHLSCIFPGMIEFSAEQTAGGVPQLQTVASWHIWAGQGRKTSNPLRIDYSHLPLVDIDNKAGAPSNVFDETVTNTPPSAEDAIDQDLLDGLLSTINTKTYYVLGWHDAFVDGTIETWKKIRQAVPDAKIMIGPYHHNLCDMETASIGMVATKDVELNRYYEQMDMFFAQHLKDEENELSRNTTALKIFVMGKNQWRDENEWPLSRTLYKNIYLHSAGNAGKNIKDGRLSWVAPSGNHPCDEYFYDPLNPVDWSAKLELWNFLNDMGNRDEVEARDDVLVYSTPALEDDLEITGNVVMQLFAASSAPDTDFVATLVDVYPSGHTQYITQGIVRARYRNGVGNESFIEPEKTYQYEIKMQATSNTFQKGHRLRLEVTSSEFSKWARNQNVADPLGTTTNTQIARQKIHHGGTYLSHLILPVIPNM